MENPKEILFSRWRDPVTKAFSCEIDSTGRSCDNMVLFTAEACALGLISVEEFNVIVEQFEHPSGCLIRYPGVEDFSSWDDYLGASAISWNFAWRAYQFLSAHNWTTQSGSKLWRFPLFIPAIKASASLPLSFLDQLMASGSYLWNALTEPKQETSGKILLYMAAPHFDQYWMIKLAIKFWIKSLVFKYDSISQVFEIYFPNKKGETHPIVDVVKSLSH